jgi:hypothetical protein
MAIVPHVARCTIVPSRFKDYLESVYVARYHLVGRVIVKPQGYGIVLGQGSLQRGSSTSSSNQMVTQLRPRLVYVRAQPKARGCSRGYLFEFA